MEKPFNKFWRRVIVILIFLSCVYLICKYFKPFGISPWYIKTKAIHFFLESSYYPMIHLFKTMIFTGWFWGVLAFTLIMERIIPAKPNQKMFSLSFAQDLVWFFYETVLNAFILVTYVSLMTWVFNKYFYGLKSNVIEAMPDFVRFLFAFLVQDLMYWLQHFINHKVPLFWEFHKIHHSQKELNFFTDFRYHVLEYIVRQTFLVTPFLIFQVNPPVIVAFAIFREWYTRFYHGNIKTDMGPLRYILVTPQSHRVHHSIEEPHWDKNFGSILAIWDFIFRTQYTGFHEYPNTGIKDDDFPHEHSHDLKSLLLMPIKQMHYPFKSIKQKWLTKRR